MLEIVTAEDLRLVREEIHSLHADFRHLMEAWDKTDKHVQSLQRRLTKMADATQADIDALTAEVNQVATDLGDAQSKLQAEIDALAAQGVDVTALQAAVQPLDGAVQALGNIGPTPAA
jgi:hypothetical protein